MLGQAAVAMWWDVAPEMQAEWEDWHTHEHMPERLDIPGFLRGSRWISRHSYFVLYELDSPDTLTGPAYLERLNNPTPWSQKMMPHHLNLVRSLCHVRASFGRGVGHALATLRREVSAPTLSALPARKGLAAAHLLESLPKSGIPRTTEQNLRGGGDAHASWVALVGGYDADAVAAAAREIDPAAGLYRLSYCLTAQDAA